MQMKFEKKKFYANFFPGVGVKKNEIFILILECTQPCRYCRDTTNKIHIKYIIMQMKFEKKEFYVNYFSGVGVKKIRKFRKKGIYLNFFSGVGVKKKEIFILILWCTQPCRDCRDTTNKIHIKFIIMQMKFEKKKFYVNFFSGVGVKKNQSELKRKKFSF